MVRMVAVAAELNMAFFDDGMTLVTDVLAQTSGLLFSVTFAAERTSSVAQKADVSEFVVADFAAEAVRMPARVHRLDHSSDDEFTASATAGRVEDVKVVFAILAPFELEEDTVWEGSEALRANEAFLMPHFTARVDNLLRYFEALRATEAEDVIKSAPSIRQIHAAT